MKTLLVIPLIVFFLPPCPVRACDSLAPTSVAIPATAPTTRVSPPAENDALAKKNSAAPTTPHTAAPKQHRAARPGYLFM